MFVVEARAASCVCVAPGNIIAVGRESMAGEIKAETTFFQLKRQLSKGSIYENKAQFLGNWRKAEGCRFMS